MRQTAPASYFRSPNITIRVFTQPGPEADLGPDSRQLRSAFGFAEYNVASCNCSKVPKPASSIAANVVWLATIEQTQAFAGDFLHFVERSAKDLVGHHLIRMLCQRSLEPSPPSKANLGVDVDDC